MTAATVEYCNCKQIIPAFWGLEAGGVWRRVRGGGTSRWRVLVAWLVRSVLLVMIKRQNAIL